MAGPAFPTGSPVTRRSKEAERSSRGYRMANGPVRRKTCPRTLGRSGSRPKFKRGRVAALRHSTERHSAPPAVPLREWTPGASCAAAVHASHPSHARPERPRTATGGHGRWASQCSSGEVWDAQVLATVRPSTSRGRPSVHTVKRGTPRCRPACGRPRAFTSGGRRVRCGTPRCWRRCGRPRAVGVPAFTRRSVGRPGAGGAEDARVPRTPACRGCRRVYQVFERANCNGAERDRADESVRGVRLGLTIFPGRQQTPDPR